MKKIFSVIVLFMFTCSISYAFHGIVPESFEPIKRYEKAFQDAIDKDPKTFVSILTSLISKMDRDEKIKILQYVEYDLFITKVEPRIINWILTETMMGTFSKEKSDLEKAGEYGIPENERFYEEIMRRALRWIEEKPVQLFSETIFREISESLREDPCTKITLIFVNKDGSADMKGQSYLNLSDAAAALASKIVERNEESLHPHLVYVIRNY